MPVNFGSADPLRPVEIEEIGGRVHSSYRAVTVSLLGGRSKNASSYSLLDISVFLKTLAFTQRFGRFSNKETVKEVRQ